MLSKLGLKKPCLTLLTLLRFELQVPSRGASQDESGSRKSSSSSSVSSSEVHPFDTSRRPTLVRSSKTFDQDELPNFKKVRISDSRRSSSSGSSDDEENVANVKIVEVPAAKVVNNNNNNMDVDDESSSSNSSDDDVNANRLSISHQHNGSMSSFESNVEDVVFSTPNVVYATESIVEDDPPVKQCQKGSFSVQLHFSHSAL